VSEVQESADIFFSYRPKVDVEVVRGPDDVQRFYMVIKPAQKTAFGRIIIERKRLPDVSEHERTWGFVDLVSSNAEQIEDEIRSKALSDQNTRRTLRTPGLQAKASMRSCATTPTRILPMRSNFRKPWVLCSAM
jgi:hypothetical protein